MYAIFAIAKKGDATDNPPRIAIIMFSILYICFIRFEHWTMAKCIKEGKNVLIRFVWFSAHLPNAIWALLIRFCSCLYVRVQSQRTNTTPPYPYHTTHFFVKRQYLFHNNECQDTVFFPNKNVASFEYIYRIHKMAAR